VKRVRIKICGITRPEDAVCAAESGVDAIGMNFYEKSPRFVDVESANLITESLPPFICKVGLFVDQSESDINDVLQEVSIDILQFHGQETADSCRQFSKPYIKVIKMQANLELMDIIEQYHDARAILLDTYVEGVVGGTGEKFDWNLIPKQIHKPLILAGGLNHKNVAEAIRQVKPFAVDVSGGVETTKGIKSHKKIEDFVRAVMGEKQNY